ncbi:uncharacterized protein LOC134794518 [Cydia splendana]|uniref:uncharacterized protein LOC134794518 n=1 Tax=Cydia splendana TaxID=1100963 RepID=UPI00300D1AF9
MTTKSAANTRKATARQLEMQLKTTTQDLQESRALSKQLLQDREESELQFKKLVDTNSDLRRALADNDVQLTDVRGEVDRLQEAVDSFNQCASTHEVALTRITHLEEELGAANDELNLFRPPSADFSTFETTMESVLCAENKIDVIVNTNLISICESAFSVDEIKQAKTLLFESIKTSQKKIKRRNDGQKRRDLEDILAVLKVLDPDDIPVFVARDLHKLPAVTFDHTDVTKVLKELVLLRIDMDSMKEKYATIEQLHDLKKEFQSGALEQTPDSLRNRNVNIKRGGYMLDSGPPALSVLDVSENSLEASGKRCSASEDCALAHSQAPADVSVPCAAVNSTVLETHTDTKKSPIDKSDDVRDVRSKQPTMAEIASTGAWKSNESTEGWKIASSKKTRRFASRKGAAVDNTNNKFRAADTRVPLFISNVNKEAAEEDICEYIKMKTGECVTLHQIKMKKERSYNAFKCYVSKSKLSTFLDDQLWPDGIIFRRFIRRTNEENKDGRQINTHTHNNGE